MTNEELEELDRLTELSPIELSQMLHAIWLQGFYQGEQDTAWRIQKVMHGAIGDIFIAGDDVVATKLRHIYTRATDAIQQATKGGEANTPNEEAAKENIRRVFRLVRQIVVREMER